MAAIKKPTPVKERTVYSSPKIQEFGPIRLLTRGGVSGAPEMGMSMSQKMTDLP